VVLGDGTGLMAGNQTKVPKDLKMLVISGCSDDALITCHAQGVALIRAKPVPRVHVGLIGEST
jgi:hypothetical protein